MSMLVILLPARPHLADSAAATAGDDWAYVLSPDGLSVGPHGRASAAQCPRADSVVAVVGAHDLGWHRLALPKAPANRLRAALGGLLEDQLLDDDEAVHLAVAPQAAAGQPTWVAALHKPWLQAQLAALQAAGLTVDRVVPALAPLPAEAAAPQGQFFLAADADPSDEHAPCWLALAQADAALCLPLAGALARTRLAGASQAGAVFHATPAAAALAERWLGAPVAVRTESEAALAAARSGWNLLQFDLAPQRRGTRALAEAARQLLSPAWRPARWGLVALLLAQVVGLNLWAWHQQRQIDGQRQAMADLLRSAHPQVRAVLDAPLQMARETEQLRERAGVPGDTDFEPLLAAAAAAWPEGQPPAPQLRYEPGRLSLPATGWAPPAIEQLRQRLQPTGWVADSAEGRLTIQRAPAPGR